MLSARRATGGPRSFTIGLFSATAFVVRPQFLLTWLLDTCAHVASRYRRRGPRAAGAVLAWLTVPMLIALAVSSARFHRLSGQWGLISANASLNRLFADTDVCRVEARSTSAGGEHFGWHFSPPPSRRARTTTSCDSTASSATQGCSNRSRRQRLRGVAWIDRVTRATRNVELLAVRNDLFPENEYEESRFRRDLQTGFASILLFGILPLCVVGLVLGRSDRLKFLALANVAAVVVAAARYYGESRYRTPYDPFAILFAVVGAYELGSRAVALARRCRTAPRGAVTVRRNH